MFLQDMLWKNRPSQLSATIAAGFAARFVMVDELLFVAACVLLDFDFCFIVGLASFGANHPNSGSSPEWFLFFILSMLGHCHGALLGVQVLISHAIGSLLEYSGTMASFFSGTAGSRKCLLVETGVKAVSCRFTRP